MSKIYKNDRVTLIYDNIIKNQNVRFRFLYCYQKETISRIVSYSTENISPAMTHEMLVYRKWDLGDPESVRGIK
jgi:hypothetical protein